MSPPSAAIETPLDMASNGKHDEGKHGEKFDTPAPHEPGLPTRQSKAAIQHFPSPPTFTDKYLEREYLKGRLALAFRIFAKLGFDEGVAGHITLRDPVEPDSFWVNPFGVAWPLMKASDLIRVGKEGKVVEGGRCRLLNAAAYCIHHAVHTARPDLNCVAHSHSIYGRTFSTFGRPISLTTQDSCAFYNDLAIYTAFRGVVLAAEEGESIARALGNKKAAILQNHGLLTGAKTVEAAVFWFMSLEKCCYTQLMTDAVERAGKYDGEGGSGPVEISDEDAALTWKTVGTEQAGWFSAKPTFDMMEFEGGDYKW